MTNKNGQHWQWDKNKANEQKFERTNEKAATERIFEKIYIKKGIKNEFRK